MRHRSFLFVTAATVLLYGGLCTNAIAAPVIISSGPANHCKPALPLFEGKIRTRPLAVQNEGDTTAFVTCSMSLENGAIESVGVETTRFEIFVQNKNDETITVNCTGVSGFDGGGNVFVPGPVTLAPGTTRVLRFDADDFSEVGDMPSLVSFSCALPPGGAINDMYVFVDNGA